MLNRNLGGGGFGGSELAEELSEGEEEEEGSGPCMWRGLKEGNGLDDGLGGRGPKVVEIDMGRTVCVDERV